MYFGTPIAPQDANNAIFTKNTCFLDSKRLFDTKKRPFWYEMKAYGAQVIPKRFKNFKRI